MIARIYDAAANPDGAYLDGVPLRDLTEDEYNDFPAWLKRCVDACGFYSAPPADGGVLSAEEAPAGDLIAETPTTVITTSRKSRG